MTVHSFMPDRRRELAMSGSRTPTRKEAGQVEGLSIGKPYSDNGTSDHIVKKGIFVFEDIQLAFHLGCSYLMSNFTVADTASSGSYGRINTSSNSHLTPCVRAHLFKRKSEEEAFPNSPNLSKLSAFVDRSLGMNSPYTPLSQGKPSLSLR
jgi:hypothetical protein